MDDKVKIKVWVHTNKVGSDCKVETEYDREDWESMSDDERRDELMELVWNMAEWGFEEIGHD